MNLLLPTDIQTPCAVALGNFDGVHLGHRAVLRASLEAKSRGLIPTVITFDPHPRAYFGGQTGFLLSSLQEKKQILKDLGFLQILVLPFGPALAQMTAETFVLDFLIGHLKTRQVSVGWNFRFGKGRTGDADFLERILLPLGVEVSVCPPFLLGEEQVSSSAIRNALAEGDLVKAQTFLGRNYTLCGKVIHGEARGRKIGFPTANIQIEPMRFIPRYGVYLTKVTWKGQQEIGLTNIGVRPTFNGSAPSIEVHLLSWSGDLYDQELTLEFTDFIRPELQFNSVDELVAQIHRDRDTAVNLILNATKR
ncbi:MAG: bifunctional riboflavin kinase/FAD synthetase [Gloeobacterales cyanobacterium]